MLKIKFTDITGLVPEEFYPTPQKNHIPGWLKSLSPYAGDKGFVPSGDGSGKQTAKRCVPMLDAVMTGYSLLLTEDILVENEDGFPFFKWPAGLGIDFHNAGQVGNPNGAPIPKWNNPFTIQTPMGYSTLIVPPLNETPVFNIFSGVVDTDSYSGKINLPFKLIRDDWTGIVSAGTPIAQLIPFKRDDWEMEVRDEVDTKFLKDQRKIQSLFKDGYRNLFWNRKSYN